MLLLEDVTEQSQVITIDSDNKYPVIAIPTIDARFPGNIIQVLPVCLQCLAAEFHQRPLLQASLDQGGQHSRSGPCRTISGRGTIENDDLPALPPEFARKGQSGDAGTHDAEIHKPIHSTGIDAQGFRNVWFRIDPTLIFTDGGSIVGRGRKGSRGAQVRLSYAGITRIRFQSVISALPADPRRR